MRIIDTALRLLGATSGEQIIKTAAAASGQITLPAGTVDFSASGPGHVQQASAGAAFTVGNTASNWTVGAPGAVSGGTLTGDVVAQRVVVNANTVANALAASPGQTLVLQGADTAAVNAAIYTFGGNPNWNCLRSQGTASSQVTVASGNIVGRYTGGGWDGSAWRNPTATLTFTATEAFGTNVGTSVLISATPTGSASPAAVATFQLGVQIGAPTGGDKGAGTLNAATGVYANNVLLTSDERLKRDIEPLADGCLDLVEAIAPKSFRFIEPEPQPAPDEDMAPTPAGPPGWFDRTRWGFVAQDVEKLIPEAVEVGDDGMRSLSYNDLVAVLWRGTQELTARVKALEAALDARSASGG